MGESQGGERGLDMTPCSLANAQRVFWGGGGDIDGRRRKRRKRSDSRQVRKNDKALKRRKDHRQKTENSAKEGGKITLTHTHFASSTSVTTSTSP